MTLALDTKSPLAVLSQTLDQACCLDPSSAGFALGVRAALGGLSRETGLLSDAQRESGLDCYRRHLLVADPLGRYAVAALVWQAGQASPVHGHHTWCAYTMIVRHEVACRSCSHFNGGNHPCHRVHLGV
jgi:predicted metal-dependent enzyme (double-stranded beta helix superfamily)